MATGAPASGLTGASPSPDPPILPQFLPIPEDPLTEKICNNMDRHGLLAPSTLQPKHNKTNSKNQNNVPLTTNPPSSTAAIQRACLQQLHNTLNPPAGTTTPTTSNAHEMQYTPVLNKKTRAKKERKLLPTTGLLLTKIGSRKDIDRKPVNIPEILTALLSIDPHAYLLPHNRVPNRMTKLQQMLASPQDYNTFMDISRLHWGKPSDNNQELPCPSTSHPRLLPMV